jgi:hypothetical protein
VARFEQRIGEAEVTAARNQIAGGASLRSAAARIGCAPSTLSLRIRKAEQAEGAARERAGIHAKHNQRQPKNAALHASAAGDGVAGDVGPVEILRGALLATKASGDPDWPTRVSAARTLAQLRPEELEPKTEPVPTSAPSIIVYDLPPGAHPVLHCASSAEPAPPVGDAEASPQQPSTSGPHWFYYDTPEGQTVTIGSWSPPDLGPSADPNAVIQVGISRTADRPTAELWQAELSAGRLPSD